MPPGADASLDVRVLLADRLLRVSRSIGIGSGRGRIGFIARHPRKATIEVFTGLGLEESWGSRYWKQWCRRKSNPLKRRNLFILRNVSNAKAA
jgi:hypothetical protein